MLNVTCCEIGAALRNCYVLIKLFCVYCRAFCTVTTTNIVCAILCVNFQTDCLSVYSLGQEKISSVYSWCLFILRSTICSCKDVKIQLLTVCQSTGLLAYCREFGTATKSYCVRLSVCLLRCSGEFGMASTTDAAYVNHVASCEIGTATTTTTVCVNQAAWWCFAGNSVRPSSPSSEGGPAEHENSPGKNKTGASKFSAQLQTAYCWSYVRALLFAC